MNCVIENIEYLIHRHDCVVVPAWGAFISNSQSARYDEENLRFIPPHRSVSFNPDVAHNDGLLASSIARRNGITFERAAKIVEEETQCMRRQFDLDGEISFGALGRFIHQEQGSPIFQPSEMLLRIESYCLPAVDATPIIKLVKAEEEKLIRAEKQRRPSATLRLLKVAASLAVAVTVGAMLLIPSFSGRNDNLAGVTTPSLTLRPSQTSSIPSSDGLVLSIALPGKEEVKTEPVEVVESEEISEAITTAEQQVAPVSVTSVANTDPVTPRLDSADRYCLVVASLPSAALAEKYIAEQKGESLNYFESDGKFRVYAATGSSGSALTKADPSLSQIFESHPDVWVCRMK